VHVMPSGSVVAGCDYYFFVLLPPLAAWREGEREVYCDAARVAHKI
jgi:hypothetical protein